MDGKVNNVQLEETLEELALTVTSFVSKETWAVVEMLKDFLIL